MTTKIKGFPETPCPYSNVAGDHNDELVKAKADAFVKQAVHTITSSRAWTGHSASFVTADESDYDGSDAADNYYLSTAGCCDSPYLPAGDPDATRTTTSDCPMAVRRFSCCACPRAWPGPLGWPPRQPGPSHARRAGRRYPRPNPRRRAGHR